MLSSQFYLCLATARHASHCACSACPLLRADLGRFLQVDPVGYAEQRNLYAYVGNDPLNATGPTGQFEMKVRGDCTQSCRAVDDQAATGGGITHVGVFTPTSGPEHEPRTPGTADTSNVVGGAGHYMGGSGQAGREGLTQILEVYTDIAITLGNSITGSNGSAGTLQSLVQ